jgi:hypothetical protein
MEFASEMIMKAQLAGLKISEIPITLHPDGRSRPPHLKSWRDGWRHLKLMLLYAPRWLYVYPALLLLLPSILGFLFLLPGPLTIGGVRFDTNTLLMMYLGIALGFQILLCGAFTTMFAQSHGLVPVGRFAHLVFRINPFEAGLCVGLPLTGAVLFFFVRALSRWWSVDLGDLPYAQGLRLVIPAVTGISLGVQAIFGGFVLAILRIKAPSSNIDCAEL